MVADCVGVGGIGEGVVVAVEGCVAVIVGSVVGVGPAVEVAQADRKTTSKRLRTIFGISRACRGRSFLWFLVKMGLDSQCEFCVFAVHRIFDLLILPLDGRIALQSDD
jgi:hypothetical protein